jgi:hypothetical protein
MTEEEIIQCKAVEYLTELKRQGKIRKYTAIPNSTFTTSWSAKGKNIKMGVRRGLFDLFVVGLDKHYFLELKTLKGTLSEHQKEWKEVLDAVKCLNFVTYGFDEAIELINSLL